MRRRLTSELLIAGLLFLLPLLLFWPQTVGGKTLIPAENLYQYAPYSTYAEVVRAPATPHNPLLDDLILQNYQWKAFIRESIDAGKVPLWNPHQFSGIPFMAAGQQSTLYPLSVLYYVLPLPAAYGWFTVLNLWLAGLFMMAFVRGIAGRSPDANRFGGVVAAITYQLCGFFIASTVHPMIVAAAAWLPVLLLMAEFVIRRQAIFGRPAVTPWVSIGAVALAFNIFAGHPELTIYTLLITGYYSACRLIWTWWRDRSLPDMVTNGAWLLGMIALGFALGAVQFIPLFDVANANWRTERDSLQAVLSFAHPFRDLLQYVMPNFYGSPADRAVFDWFAMESVPVTVNAFGDPIQSTDWGIKNYVEAALYVGIMPLALAAFALIVPRQKTTNDAAERPPQKWIFAGLTVIALTFMFGLPTYALIYPLPGISQLNTAFRWVYGVTAGVAVLAGLGAAALVAADDPRVRKWARRFGWGLLAVGALTLIGLLASRLLFDQLEPLVERVFTGMAKAQGAFPDTRAFYSFQFTNMLIFGVVTAISGFGFLFIPSPVSPPQQNGAGERQSLLVQVGVVLLIAADLMIASWGFNPASDPALLDFTPPSVEWLQERQEEDGPFRYITLEDPATGFDKTFQANATLRHGLDDVRGYESIISADTVAYMRTVQIQPQLDFNRIAPLFLDRVQGGEVNWDRLALLNVRYVIAQQGVVVPDDLPLEAVQQTPAVVIYAFSGAIGPAFTAPGNSDAPPTFDDFASFSDAGLTDFERTTSRERLVQVALADPRWLVLSESMAPGWRAFVRPTSVNADGDRADEREIDLVTAVDNFPAVRLDPAAIADLYATDDLSPEHADALANGELEVRFVYSPQSFQVGAFGSVIGAALIVFLMGVWFWGVFVGEASEEDGDAGKVARNSIAPIVLNLFNRGIDFAFALVMLRILGPTDAGIYYYAIVVFVWFDIFTNFGLDVFLIREASRDRDRSAYFLLNTTYMRFFLAFACVPLVIGFLALRQASIDPPLNSEALIAIGLLYIGLAPGSISKGLTSIFYAYQKAEYPAAVTTITTINKAVFGLIALLLGYGIVGLAAVSIGVNVLTLGILTYAALRVMRPSGENRARPKLRPDIPLIRNMTRESWPLMLNHFLATIFFQIDIIILEAVKGARIVGQYSVAYRWLLAINIIPAFFTQALLPVMSRQAQDDRAALKRTYTLGVKLLVALAVPLAVGFTVTAEALTLILGGAAFMPNGAIALQIMIWSIPIGWMNSLTQYALIAVDLQRAITRAFAVAVTFNIVSNLAFIPAYGFRAAAVTTIFSEMVLLIPFAVLMQRALGKIDWLDMVWRPVAAGGAMAVTMLVLWPLSPLIALSAGGLVYPVVLIALRPLNADEHAMIAPVLPGRVARLLGAA